MSKQSHRLLLSSLILALLLLTAIATATPYIAYEQSAVGRIVGDSPEEMAQQLERQEITLDSADYFSSSISSTPNIDTQHVIEKSYPTHSINIPSVFEQWNWNDVKDAIDERRSGQLLAIESKGELTSNGLSSRISSSFETPLTPDTISWEGLQRHPSVMIFDSNHAGIGLPKQDTFVSRIGQDSALIAPTSIADPEFVKALACNLGKAGTLGESYRLARNNYYWNANSPSGLTLMSYMLYAPPTMTIKVPGYSESEIREHCENYLHDYSSLSTQEQPPVSISREIMPTIRAQETFSNFYTQRVTVTINDYTLLNEGNHSLLGIPGASQRTAFEQTVLPQLVDRTRLPLRTVVRNITLISAEDPVTIPIPNLPSWQDRYVDRDCSQTSTSPLIESAHSSSDNSEFVLVNLNPAQVNDCIQGTVTLYKKITYLIDYHTFSPVIFDSVQTSERNLPGQATSISVQLLNVRGQSATGTLVLMHDGRVVSEKVVTVGPSGLSTILAFTAADNEGLQEYTLQYVQDNEALTEITIPVDIRTLSAVLLVPDPVLKGSTAALAITNHDTVMFDLELHLLIRGSTTILDTTQQQSLSPGLNIIDIALPDLARETPQYTMLAELLYANKRQTISSTLSTNHAPVLAHLEDITLAEGSRATITVSATDQDHDPLSITISEPLGDDGIWYTDFDSAGNYTATITASDGLLSDVQTIQIHVTDATNQRTVLFRDCNFGLYRGGFAEVSTDSDFDGALESWYFTQSSELDEAFGWKTPEGWPVGLCGFNKNNLCIDDSGALDLDWFLGIDLFPDSVFSRGGTCDSSSQPNPTYKEHETCAGTNCEYPLCNLDSQCGNDTYVEEPFCTNNSVYWTWRSHSCQDAATYESSCTYSDQIVKLEDCQAREVCSQGACVPVECYTSSECGTDGYRGPYCTGSGVTNDWRAHTCQNPGTAQAQCSYNDRKDLISTCSIDETCTYGNCVPKNFSILGTFDDGKSSQNITFTRAANKTFFITLPWNADIRNATLLVEGGP